MPKISILLTNQQYEELIFIAKERGLTITDLVLSQLPIIQEKKITLSDVLGKVKNRTSGEFSIPSLYTIEEWKSFTKGSKLTVGKQFYKEIANLEGIEFLRKNSANLAIYRKKWLSKVNAIKYWFFYL